jgi:hypothetical protein
LPWKIVDVIEPVSVTIICKNPVTLGFAINVGYSVVAHVETVRIEVP